MGALFGFAAFWVAVFALLGIWKLAEMLWQSGLIEAVLYGIAELIDWIKTTVKNTRNFFAQMFSNTKRWVYECETEGRKIREQKGICRHS